MRISAFSLIIIYLIVFVLTGCKFYTHRYIEIALPVDSLIIEWLVEYPQRIDDGPAVFAVETIVADSTKTETRAMISIARGVNLPVLARPVFLGITGGFPAGAVYPVDIKGRLLTLEWEDGFACEILKTCLLNSETVAAFDTLRFRASIIEKAAELKDSEDRLLPGGGWLFDPVSIMSRLGYGLFRESSIKIASTMSFSLPVIGGSFISDNPLYPRLESSGLGYGEVLDVLIPINRRTLFINSESGEIVEVFFDDSRWCWTNLLTEASGSGRM